MLIQLIHKKVPVRELVLKDALVFLVEANFKPVLGYSRKVGHCEVDFRNVHVELYQISTEIQMALEQEIIELVRLSAAEGVGDMGFNFSCISIGTGSLIKIKSVSKSAKYVSQLFISILTLMGFGL